MPGTPSSRTRMFDPRPKTPHGHLLLVAPPDQGDQFIEVGRFGEVLGRPPQLEPGVHGQRLILAARSSRSPLNKPIADLPYVPRSHGHHYVARPQSALQEFEYRPGRVNGEDLVAAGPGLPAKSAAVDLPGSRVRLPGPVHLGDYHLVGILQSWLPVRPAGGRCGRLGAAETRTTAAGAGTSGGSSAGRRPPLWGGGRSRRSASRRRQVPTTSSRRRRPANRARPSSDLVRIDVASFVGQRGGRQGIEHVVLARHLQRHVAEVLPAGMNRETVPALAVADFPCRPVGRCVQPKVTTRHFSPWMILCVTGHSLRATSSPSAGIRSAKRRNARLQLLRGAIVVEVVGLDPQDGGLARAAGGGSWPGIRRPRPP